MKSRKTTRPVILVTNDDGISAKGIKELVSAIEGLGDIVVVAPDSPRSGQSSAITSNLPLRLTLVEEREGYKAYKTNGTPVDCVKLSMHRLFDRHPDLLVSGINHGSNAGISILYSGTMGAALEGTIIGIPALGFSLTSHSADADFSGCKPIIRELCAKTLEKGLPEGICLNVNIPEVPEVKGIKVCRQAKGYWTEEYANRLDPQGHEYFWLTGFFKNQEPDNPDTDEWALAHDYASLVPCTIDMTAEKLIGDFKKWVKEE